MNMEQPSNNMKFVFFLALFLVCNSLEHEDDFSLFQTVTTTTKKTKKSFARVFACLLMTLTESSKFY